MQGAVGVGVGEQIGSCRWVRADLAGTKEDSEEG